MLSRAPLRLAASYGWRLQEQSVQVGRSSTETTLTSAASISATVIVFRPFLLEKVFLDVTRAATYTMVVAEQTIVVTTGGAANDVEFVLDPPAWVDAGPLTLSCSAASGTWRCNYESTFTTPFVCDDLCVSDKGAVGYYGAFRFQIRQTRLERIGGPDLPNPFLGVAPLTNASDYSIVWLPDLGGGQNLWNQVEWIVANAARYRIALVCFTGDLIQSGTWDNVDTNLDALEAAGIPYVAPPGNHDYVSLATRQLWEPDGADCYSGTVSTTRIAAQAWWNGDVYATGHAENLYFTFAVGGIDYLVFGLEFGPRQAVMDWVVSVMQAHPTHKVIISTHSYLSATGSLSVASDTYDPHAAIYFGAGGDANNGTEMWADLKDEGNLFFVGAGHDVGEYGQHVIAQGTDGNLVHQLFANYQEYTNTGNGYLVVTVVRPGLNKIHRIPYSPVEDATRVAFYREGGDFPITLAGIPDATPSSAPTVASVDPISGDTTGGTAVTVTGTGFVDGASIAFGGTAATNVAFVSATELTCDTPAHAAGVVSVRVVNPDTQSGTLPDAFLYISSNVAPVADAGDDQAITGALPVSTTLDGSATDDGLPDPPAALTYLWEKVSGPGAVTFVDETDPATDVAFAAYGTYVLRLTVDDGDLSDSDEVSIVAAAPLAEITQVVVRTRSRRVVEPCAEPTAGEDLTTATTGPLLFSTWDALGTGVLQAYDELAAPDSADYYGGRKWPWLMSLGPVRRALSDHKGNYEVGRFDLKWADPERRIRQLLASAPGKYSPGREVAAYLVSDAGRRAKVRPYLVAWGLVDGAPKYGADLSIDLSCRDVVGSSNRGWGLDGEALVPKRVIAPPEFPEARNEVRELGVPFPLGRITDELPIAGDAPVITGNVDKDRGYDTSAASSGATVGDWSGFGDTGGPAPPTDVTVEEIPDAGIYMGGDAHDAPRYFALVWSVDANGVEGDPEPFHTGAEITLASRASALRVSWTASPAAAKYRAAIGWAWYGVNYTQVLETTGTSVDFTKNPDWAPELVITPSLITPGAQLPSGGIWAGFYRVSAVFADGTETALSDGRLSGGSTEGRWAVSKPYRRPTRLEWLPVTDATLYRIYRMGIYGPYNTMFEVAAPQCYFDDWNVGGVAVAEPVPPHGAFQPIYVGDVTIDGETWRELLVAGCAIADITDWYYDNGSDPPEKNLGEGVDYLIPFTASWSARFSTPYRDIAGSDGVTRRRTVIYARGTKGDAIAAGTATLRVNVEGVEDVGNGSGVVLTDLYDQAIWVLEQLVLQDYQTGGWTCPPFFPGTSVCQVHRPSFRAVGLQRKRELAGGYVGAWVVGANGERASVQDWLRRICESGQMRIGPNRFWQLKAWAIDPALSLSALPHVREARAVDRESGDPIPQYEHLANVIPFRYGPPLDADTEWLGESDVRDAASIAAATGYGREFRREDALELYCLRQPTIARHAAGQALLYSRLIPHTIQAVGDLRFTVFDLGDAFRYDHYRGLGADGYVDRPMVVIGWTFLSERRQIELECLDLGDIVSS